MLGVHRYAGHRANLHALRLVKVPYAFGALAGVDLIDLLPQINRIVGALGLADIAVDAFIGDHQRHAQVSSRVSTDFMPPIIPRTRAHSQTAPATH